MRRITKNRRNYAILFLLGLAIEVVIGIYVHDQLIRPYFGDVLVVVVVYCAARMFFPSGIRAMPAYVLLLALLVETLQAIGISSLPIIAEHRALRIVLGSTFDWKDVLCYFVGCVLIFIIEKIRKRSKQHKGID